MSSAKLDKWWVRIFYFFVLIIVAPVLYMMMFVDGVVENIKDWGK